MKAWRLSVVQQEFLCDADARQETQANKSHRDEGFVLEMMMVHVPLPLAFV
jgi:hypothetical protein